MKARISWTKSNCVWKPTHNDLKIIEYERQHFKNYELLNMKPDISWTKNNCVWKPTLLILKIIVCESQQLKY